MRTHTIDALLAAANPVPAGRLSSAVLEEAGAEMLAAILAEPAHNATTPLLERRRKARAGSSRRLPRARWLTATAAGAAAVGILIFTVTGLGGTEGGTPAFAAVLVRYAENSPLVMLQMPGWHTSDAIEDSPQEGELHYLPDGSPQPGYRQETELHWRTGPLSGWVNDRAASSDFSTVASVLGTQAKVFRYRGGSATASTFTALWVYQGRVLEYRATVPDLATFEQMLNAIHQVDETTWLSALPSSVITAAEHPATVSAMLAGVPLPPGFDVSRIRPGGLAQNRYQVGATVAGTVACDWIKRWMEGRQSGNAGEVSEAVAAMATSPHWPVLRSMESQGAYPQVLEEYASEMGSGTWHGRSLGAAANSGLGCAADGVSLPLTQAELASGPQLVHSPPSG